MSAPPFYGCGLHDSVCRPGVIRVFQKHKPNIWSLAREGDVEGLIKAAAHSEFVPGPDGRHGRRRAHPRKALFALRDVAPDRAGHVFTTALGDPSDRVRCAAVVALYERGDAKRLAEGVGRLPGNGGYDEPTAKYRALVLPTDGVTVAGTDGTLIVRPERAQAQRAGRAAGRPSAYP
jgi:hypothetical protein